MCAALDTATKRATATQPHENGPTAVHRASGRTQVMLGCVGGKPLYYFPKYSLYNPTDLNLPLHMNLRLIPNTNTNSKHSTAAAVWAHVHASACACDARPHYGMLVGSESHSSGGGTGGPPGPCLRCTRHQADLQWGSNAFT